MATRAPAVRSSPRPWREARVQLALAALGALSMLPPYVGPPLGLELDVRASVELVDHVIAGGVVALCGVLGALLARRRPLTQTGIPGIVLYSSAFLAGLFESATHAPLVIEAARGIAPWGPALLHSALAPVITVIALWLTARTLAVIPAESPAGERHQRP